jgi:hypothetical protein
MKNHIDEYLTSGHGLIDRSSAAEKDIQKEISGELYRIGIFNEASEEFRDYVEHQREPKYNNS